MSTMETRTFNLQMSTQPTACKISYTFPSGEAQFAAMEALSSKLDDLAEEYEKAIDKDKATVLRLLWLGGMSVYVQLRSSLVPSLPSGELTHTLCTANPQSSVQA